MKIFNTEVIRAFQQCHVALLNAKHLGDLEAKIYSGGDVEIRRGQYIVDIDDDLQVHVGKIENDEWVDMEPRDFLKEIS